MKTYIIFCYCSTTGGGQNYVNSKVLFLEEQGWNVIVIEPIGTRRNKTIPWPNLKKYGKYQLKYINNYPDFWGRSIVNRTIDKIVSWVPENSEVIIESHTDFWACWGELLAKQLQGKNFCYLLDEQLEHCKHKDFLYYKYLRGEIASIHETSIKRLFENYATIDDSADYFLSAVVNGSVEDVTDKDIAGIRKSEWSIGYIGRKKQYTDQIKTDILKFAVEYPEKEIDIIVLGDIGNIDIFNKTKNIRVVQLGFKTPIPRQYFSKVDVVIAGSGCAELSYRQGVPTIVADAGTCKSIGILGYTTGSFMFATGNTHSYIDDLVSVFDTKEYLNGHVEVVVDNNQVDNYKKCFDMIEKSNSCKEYYTFKNRLKFGVKDYLFCVQTYIKLLANDLIDIFRSNLID